VVPVWAARMAESGGETAERAVMWDARDIVFTMIALTLCIMLLYAVIVPNLRHETLDDKAVDAVTKLAFLLAGALIAWLASEGASYEKP